MQGVCADCWGSKGGRQFWLRKHGPGSSLLEGPLGFDPSYILAVAAAIVLAVGAVLWISG